MLLPPAVPHVHDGKAWLSIVLDDLFKLESPFGPCCFLPVPGMNGWMMKVNALVACPPRPGAELLCGYQILTLDFEQTRGPSSWVKTMGARATQMVPTQRARFSMSAGATGCTESSSMATGTACSAEVTSADGRELLVKLNGRLVPLDDKSRALCEFVVGHPTKFLAQQRGARCGCCSPRPADAVLSGSDISGARQQLAYASWREGFECSAEGCMVRARTRRSPVHFSSHLAVFGCIRSVSKRRSSCCQCCTAWKRRCRKALSHCMMIAKDYCREWCAFCNQSTPWWTARIRLLVVGRHCWKTWAVSTRRGPELVVHRAAALQATKTNPSQTARNYRALCSPASRPRRGSCGRKHSTQLPIATFSATHMLQTLCSSSRTPTASFARVVPCVVAG